MYHVTNMRYVGVYHTGGVCVPCEHMLTNISCILLFLQPVYNVDIFPF